MIAVTSFNKKQYTFNKIFQRRLILLLYSDHEEINENKSLFYLWTLNILRDQHDIQKQRKTQ